jgi:hypothetical protein
MVLRGRVLSRLGAPFSESHRLFSTASAADVPLAGVLRRNADVKFLRRANVGLRAIYRARNA